MSVTRTQPETSVAEMASRVRVAARVLARLSNERRNEILAAAAAAIEDHGSEILDANAKDCLAAHPTSATGTMSAAMFARLRISEHGIKEMAARVRDVARLADPLHRKLSSTELDNGLVLCKESCPLGVIGIVFESRPDVVPQVAALALKSGNSVLLKGGREAAHTNQALVATWRECLAAFTSAPVDSIHLLQTRADVKELLTLEGEVDLIIPRGGRELVRFVAQNTRIPVLGHGEGICHV